MAYNELVKNFKKIRDYMREFYVYGFKNRDEFTAKSARTYDDEKRRLESWLGDYMQFRQTPKGKNVFLSIDSRLSKHNPLFKAWKTKSFTDGDITLHFIILDILSDPDVKLTLNEITEKIDEYLLDFENPRTYDESTVRKKLKKYVSQGIISSYKEGKVMYYKRAEDISIPDKDVLDYFSEVLPCGVIGSYLLDKVGKSKSNFIFKHHYITGTMDSEILYNIFLAIREKRSITLESVNKKKDRITENHIIPVKVMISARSGRQYLMAYTPRFNRIIPVRTDYIVSVKIDEKCDDFDKYQEVFKDMLPYIWGVSTQGRTLKRLEHVEFIIHYDDDEKFIKDRLEREKRIGTVEHLDNNTSKFSADVYDSSELIPWVRTFICRISDVKFSNPYIDKQFKDDIKAMYKMYSVGGDE